MSTRMPTSAVTARPGAPLRRLAALLAVLLLACPAAQAESPAQAGLEPLIRQFVLAESPWPAADTQVEIAPLDSRLQLPPCQGRIQAFLPPGGTLGTRTSIGVRCPDAGGWKLFVPVTLHVQVPVRVATAALLPGSALDLGRTRIERRDIGSLPYGYLDTGDDQPRYRVRNLIAAGSVISPAQLEPLPLVQRGQRVSLNSRSAGVVVSMQGEVLADGAAGARVQVRNLQSGKIVEGLVSGPDQVDVP